MTKSEIIKLLLSKDDEQAKLHASAALVRNENVGQKVYFRGLIEFSNFCENDCHYCGIRRSNANVERYSLEMDEILECIDFSARAGYGSVVLQSGQLQSKSFVDFVDKIVQKTKEKYPEMGITLSIGEQNRKTYKKLFDSGATRYLLRIETSNRDHYFKLHPEEMSFEKRKNCLLELKDIGYQVGTGVMIESPYQTVENLADDLVFFKENDLDMIGMGPFIPHSDTIFSGHATGRLETALNMISVLRLEMPDINIAASTALQAISPTGRELGLMAGANVIMPMVTPKKYRRGFLLYDGKPCQNESSKDCMRCIIARIKSAGLTPALGETGDSEYFKKRKRG